MIFKINKIYNVLIAVAVALALGSCRDDFGLEYGEIGEGEALVAAEVNFKPLASTDLTTRTAGNVIKNVEHLWLLIYTPSGNGDATLYGEPIELNAADHGLVINQNVDRYQAEQAEAQTPQAKFKLRLPYGRYQMIVVANMPELKDEYADEIQHYNDLRNISLIWNNDVAKNKQMFGFLTYNYATTANVSQSEAPELVINQPNLSLHGWMERVVSKLTVSFDATNMKHQVAVYIKSIQIKNISKQVKLGRPSYASTINDVIPNGEKVEFKEDYPGFKQDDTHAYGLYLSNGPGVSQIGSDHSEAEPRSLFFFENDQHIPNDGRTTGKYKAQDGNKDGVVDFPNANEPEFTDGERNKDYDYRCDGVPCGTWVEVQGYYVSQNSGRPGKGSIVYRFMLGENTKDNFSVFRNKHYKLTMKFNGFANDIDWHIEYKEEDPSIQVKTPQYISYLYNSDMQVSVKLKGCDPNIPLKATIIQNRWYPDEGKGTSAGNGSTGDDGDYYTPGVGQSNNTDPLPAGMSKGDENGFLSLRLIDTDETGSSEKNANTKSNYNYYTTKYLYTRTYDISTTGNEKDNNTTDGTYNVSDVDDADGKKARVVDLPFFTRERVMTERTGYTGTNPFMSLHRVAKVRFEAVGWDGTPVTSEIVIKQVPRIDNPVGIYRSVGAPIASSYFDVNLKQWEVEPLTTNVGGANNINFIDFTSEGAWQAKIVVGSDWFTLEPLDGSADKFEGGSRLLGYDGTPVKFRWKPSDLSSPHYGLIEVRYHNMSCTHMIVVRCGNEPVKLLDTQNVKWHNTNVKSMVRGSGQTGTTYGNFVYTDASDPRDEGGLFRWGCPDGIDPSQLTKQMFNHQISGAVKTTTGGEKSGWNSFTPVGYSAWSDKNNANYGKTRPAGFEDFNALRAESRKQGGQIHLTYGALYYDGETQTRSNYHDAYMYRGGPSQVQTNRGMRGMFFYNYQTGKNIFFPLGATGWGRLMSDGTLRYGMGINGSQGTLASNTRPLLYKLFLQFGCIYWFNERFNVTTAYQNNYGVCFGWEFNYSTFNAQGFIGNQSFGDGDDEHARVSTYLPDFTKSNACYIRCVTAD